MMRRRKPCIGNPNISEHCLNKKIPSEMPATQHALNCFPIYTAYTAYKALSADTLSLFKQLSSKMAIMPVTYV